MYHSLRGALCNVPPDGVVIAEDVTAAGQKRFMVGTISKFVAIYDKLQARHWYECLVEGKASRIFLDIESETFVDIAEIVRFFTEACRRQFNIAQPTFEIVDSCSEHKFSWHVICTDIYLKNVYHVGAFVRKTVLAMQGQHGAEAVDTAVYTKNRMFRIKGSTKFGSNRVLKHAKQWHELLVQSPDTSAWLECLELDKSEPQSTSLSPSNLFRYDHDMQKWIRLTVRLSNYSTRSTYCSLLNPILAWLDKHKRANISRHKLSMNSYGQYTLPCLSTDCGIAKRCHKGNNIWFGIDIARQTVQQRCFDSDCAGKSLFIPVPTHLWNDWNNECQKKIRLGSHE